MTTNATADLLSAMHALQADMAIAIPWSTLHHWAGSRPLAVEHYAALQAIWNDVWRASNPATPPPTVYLYHGASQLTLIRENTANDPPAVALHDLAMTTAVTPG